MGFRIKPVLVIMALAMGVVNSCSLLGDDEYPMTVDLKPTKPVLFDYEIQVQTDIDDEGNPIYTTIPPGWIKIAATFTNQNVNSSVTVMALRIRESISGSECVLKALEGTTPLASMGPAPEDGGEGADEDGDGLGDHIKKVDNLFCGNIPIDTETAAGGAASFSKSFTMRVLGYQGTASEPTGRLLKSLSFSSE